jgi:hypothetical protein
MELMETQPRIATCPNTMLARTFQSVTDALMPLAASTVGSKSSHVCIILLPEKAQTGNKPSSLVLSMELRIIRWLFALHLLFQQIEIGDTVHPFTISVKSNISPLSEKRLPLHLPFQPPRQGRPITESTSCIICFVNLWRRDHPLNHRGCTMLAVIRSYTV